MIYVIGLKDGGCGIVDAQDECKAQEILVSSEDLFDAETRQNCLDSTLIVFLRNSLVLRP